MMFFKLDNFFFGTFIGLFFPIILIFFSTSLKSELNFSFDDSTIYVISCLINLPIFRYYMVNLGKDKSGRGILFSTFLFLFFYLYKYM